MRKTIELEDRETARTLLGVGDSHLRRIRDALALDIVARGDRVHLDGPEENVEKAARVFLSLQRIVKKSQHLQSSDVERVLAHASDEDESEEAHPHALPRRDRSGRHMPAHGHAAHGGDSEKPLAGRVNAMTPGQAKYIEAIRGHDVVFAIGPAGSGKTYLAVASAIEALTKNQVNRLILVRPAVEAGERLGFLPGDLAEKVNPYLRPLYDALHDMLNPHQVARFTEKGVIEIAPLAFMRGRTLNNAFVILDEAQNTTPKQMKMFLTRLGRDAKAVITGDITQVDLPDGDPSGLADARHVLRDVKGVAFVHLERGDIVRHPLVQRIVEAYDDHEGIDQD